MGRVEGSEWPVCSLHTFGRPDRRVHYVAVICIIVGGCQCVGAPPSALASHMRRYYALPLTTQQLVWEPTPTPIYHLKSSYGIRLSRERERERCAHTTTTTTTTAIPYHVSQLN